MPPLPGGGFSPGYPPLDAHSSKLHPLHLSSWASIIPRMGAIQIKSVRWHHDRIIDFILAHPTAPTQAEIAAHFGFTQSWISIIINSDAFRHRLEERKAELVDPVIAASIEERLNALAKRSLDKLLDRLDSGVPVSNSDLVAMAKLGVGDKNTRPAQPQAQNNLYVVQLPAPAENADNWLKTAQGRRPTAGVIEDITPLPEPKPAGPERKFAFFQRAPA